MFCLFIINEHLLIWNTVYVVNELNQISDYSLYKKKKLLENIN